MSSDRGTILADALIGVMITALCAAVTLQCVRLCAKSAEIRRQIIEENEQTVRRGLSSIGECIICIPETEEPSSDSS